MSDVYRPVKGWPYRRYNHKSAMDDFRFWGIVSTEGFCPLEHGDEWQRNQRYKGLRSVEHFNKPDEALCWVPRGVWRGTGRKRLKPYDGRAFQYAEFFPRSWACTGYLTQGARDYVSRARGAA